MSLKLRKAGIKDGDSFDVARFCEVEDFGPSMTSQAATEETDINRIMARVNKGLPVLTSSGTPFFGDVSEFGGLQDAIIKVQEAEDLFMQFPAQTRERFENDPVKFVEFMEDPNNFDEAVKLGLAKPKPVENTPPVPEPGVAPKP